LLQRDIPIIHGDLRLASDLDELGAFDWVIDAAANPSVLAGVDGGTSSRQLVEHNLHGTINILEFCKRRGAGLILLSTSRVYSIPALAGLPLKIHREAYRLDAARCSAKSVSLAGVTELFPTTSPISLYGATKLASEQLALEYGHAFGFPVRINRCGVMAGAGQFGRADQGIFAFWLHSWRQNEPLRYIGFGGTGYQVRDCLHPRDLSVLVQRQMQESGVDRPAVLNVSGGIESAISLAQLSEWCRVRWSDRPVGSVDQQRPFDLPWVVLDNALAERTYGWKPQTTTEAILEEIADFAEQHPDWIQFSK